MKKALIVTSVASMVVQFILPSITQLQHLGYDVEVACNFEKGNACSKLSIKKLQQNLQKMGVSYRQVDFLRSTQNIVGNIRAYGQIRAIVRSGYDLIHCHTPTAGILTRLASKGERRKGTKVLYTAHGFHFYKGGPSKSWVLYFPAEWLCAHWTDDLITINQEDYELAKYCMRGTNVHYIPGVGIDIHKFQHPFALQKSMREQFSLPEDACVLFSVGEVNKNKNHILVIEALGALKRRDLFYVIAGKGDQMKALQDAALRNGIPDNLRLLGYRNDVSNLYALADIFVFPSKREGLPVSLMEAMASGLPCIASNIRGNRDLLVEEEGGFLFTSDNAEELQKAIACLSEDAQMRNRMGKYNEKHVENFAQEVVAEKLKWII